MKLDLELAALMEAELIDRAKGGPNANPPVERRLVPRASNLSNGCEALDQHYLTGSPELPMDAFGAASVTAGKELEAGVLLDLERALSKRFGEPFVFEREVRVTTDWFTGSADAWHPGRRILADAKTASPWQWNTKKGENSPGDAYVRQLNLYASVLGAVEIIIPVRAVGKTRKDGAGIYLPFSFAPDPSLLPALEGQARAAMRGRAEGTPPVPGLPKGHWLCKGYCSYRHICPNGGA